MAVNQRQLIFVGPHQQQTPRPSQPHLASGVRHRAGRPHARRHLPLRQRQKRASSPLSPPFPPLRVFLIYRPCKTRPRPDLNLYLIPVSESLRLG